MAILIIDTFNMMNVKPFNAPEENLIENNFGNFCQID